MWKRFNGNGGSKTARRGLSAADDLTAAVLATLSDQVAILDRDGNITAVNEAWKSFDCECGDLGLQRSGVGSNYLEVCRAAEQAGAGGVEGAILGLRAVLDGSRPHYSLTYVCQSRSGRQWFRMTAAPIGSPPDGAVISHSSVAEPTLAGEPEDVAAIAPAETGEPLLRVLTEHLAKSIGTRFAFLSEVVDQQATKLRLIALWSGEGFEESFEYDVDGTPCREVMRGAICLFPADVQEYFPDDVWLKEIAAECYLAVPLFSYAGDIIGHLGVIHDQSLDDASFAEHVVRAVAARASVELERVRLVRTLEKSERTARALLNAPVDSALLVEPDGTISDLNEVAAVRMGVTVEEAIGKNVFDLFPPDVAATRRAAMEEVMTSRKPLRVEDEREGMHFETSAYPVLDPQGDVERIAIFASNVTARKLAEGELLRSEAKFRALVQSSTEGIVSTGSDGRITFMSAAAQEMFGYGSGELDGQEIETLLPERYRDQHVGDRTDYNSQPTSRPMGKGLTLAGRRKDGTEFPVEISLSPLEGLDGGDIMAVISDITQRKRAEEELRQSENRYRSLVDTLTHGVEEADVSGVITVANAALHRLYEYGDGELLGKSILDFVASDAERESLGDYLQYLMKEQPSPIPYLGRKRTKSGKIIDVEVAWDYKRDQQGQLTGFVGIITDITERKLAEDAIREGAERNAALIDAIPDMMFTLDRRGVYVDFLPAKGLEPYAPPDQFLGRTVFEVLPQSLAQDVMQGVELALDSGRPERLEYELELDDGRHQYEARILKSKEDEALAIVRDVTAQKRQEREEELRRVRDELEGRVEKEMLGKNTYGLTFREFTVLHLAANGAADKEIADQLGISTFTVSKHVANILGKMAASSRTEACVRALREGLLT